MPNNITDAAAATAKARKTLDRMCARAVKADEARTVAAHHARAAQVVAAATEAANQADQCRRGAELADRTRHRWAR